MEILKLILTTVGGGLITFFGSILYFRPKLKEAKAEAKKKEAEAQNYIYDSLVERLNLMEKQYAELNKVVDEQRGEILKLSQDKFDSEKRIVKLESENKELREQVDQLTKEVEAYRTIAGQK